MTEEPIGPFLEAKALHISEQAIDLVSRTNFFLSNLSDWDINGILMKEEEKRRVSRVSRF
jgi:hypothetical protein